MRAFANDSHSTENNSQTKPIIYKLSHFLPASIRLPYPQQFIDKLDMHLESSSLFPSTNAHNQKLINDAKALINAHIDKAHEHHSYGIWKAQTDPIALIARMSHLIKHDVIFERHMKSPLTKELINLLNILLGGVVSSYPAPAQNYKKGLITIYHHLKDEELYYLQLGEKSGKEAYNCLQHFLRCISGSMPSLIKELEKNSISETLDFLEALKKINLIS